MRKIMSVVVTALLAVSTVFGQTARTVMMGSPGQPDAYRLQSRDHIVRSNMLAVAAGDLSGTAWASTVKGLQGKAIPAPGAGDTGKGYVWNGSAWVLQTASATANWGAILGTLSNQTDLWAQLTNRYTKAETLGLFPGASVAYASVAGYATNAGYAATAGTSTYATVAGTAGYASTAGTSTYATVSGYADTAGTSSYATVAGALSGGELDPKWGAVSNDVTTWASNGQVAFTWGNHATNGYLKAGVTYYVKTTGNDANDGLTFVTAKATIVGAITAASDGDTIVVGSGIYSVTNQIMVDKAVYIRSQDGYVSTIVQNVTALTPSPQTNRVFFISKLGAVVDGFTIKDGIAENGGNVVVSYGGVLRNCKVINGLAWQYGGGLFGEFYGSVEDCIITNNVVTNRFGYTFVAGGGAVLYGDGAEMSQFFLRRCLVAENRSVGAGGIGGGVMFRYGNYMEQCTVVSNRAAGYAGSIYGGGIIGFNYGGYVRDSIVYYNIPNNHDTSGALGGALNNYITYSCITPAPLKPVPNIGVVTASPLFVDFGAKNYALSAYSPCIGTASKVGGVMDMGMYAGQYSSPTSVPYAATAGTSVYATASGYAATAGTSVYASVSGYADTAGTSVYATTAGSIENWPNYIVTQGMHNVTLGTNFHVANNTLNGEWFMLCGFITSTNSLVNLWNMQAQSKISSVTALSPVSGRYLRTDGSANNWVDLTWVPTAGTSVYATVAGYASIAGYATNAGYANTAGTSSYATAAGYADIAASATNALQLGGVDASAFPTQNQENVNFGTGLTVAGNPVLTNQNAEIDPLSLHLNGGGTVVGNVVVTNGSFYTYGDVEMRGSDGHLRFLMWPNTGSGNGFVLYGGGSLQSLDVLNRTLYASNGIDAVLSWDIGDLAVYAWTVQHNATNGKEIVNYETMEGFVSTASVFYAATAGTSAWATVAGYADTAGTSVYATAAGYADTAGTSYAARVVLDGTDLLAVDGNTRQLFASDGVSTNLDWNTKEMLGYWSIKTYGGVKVLEYYMDGGTMTDTFVLRDFTDTKSVGVEQRTLNDSSANVSAMWGNRELWDGSQVVAEWMNGWLTNLEWKVSNVADADYEIVNWQSMTGFVAGASVSYADTAGTSSYATVAGYADTAGTSTWANAAGYADNAYFLYNTNTSVISADGAAMTLLYDGVNVSLEWVNGWLTNLEWKVSNVADADYEIVNWQCMTGFVANASVNYANTAGTSAWATAAGYADNAYFLYNTNTSVVSANGSAMTLLYDGANVSLEWVNGWLTNLEWKVSNIADADFEIVNWQSMTNWVLGMGYLTNGMSELIVGDLAGSAFYATPTNFGFYSGGAPDGMWDYNAKTFSSGASWLFNANGLSFVAQDVSIGSTTTFVVTNNGYAVISVASALGVLSSPSDGTQSVDWWGRNLYMSSGVDISLNWEQGILTNLEWKVANVADADDEIVNWQSMTGYVAGISVNYASVAGYATNAGYAATAGTSDYATVAGSATNLLGPQQNNVSWNGYNITDLGQLWVTNIWLSGIILDTNSVAIFSGRTFYDAASTIVFDFSGTTGEMELGAQDGSRSLGLYGSSVDVYTNMTVTGYIQQRTNDWHYWGVENVDDSWRMGPSSTNFVVQVRVGGTWTNAVIFTRP